jgi:hypothetical protein
MKYIPTTSASPIRKAIQTIPLSGGFSDVLPQAAVYRPGFDGQINETDPDQKDHSYYLHPGNGQVHERTFAGSDPTTIR